MQDRVCIKAFLSGNLGDDLFIYTLCTRYPNTKFITCGPRKYKKNFSSINNLKYICSNPKILMIFIKPINIVFKYIKKNLKHDDYMLEVISLNDIVFHFLARKSKYNILISGSYFIEPEKSYRINRKKFLRDKQYYILKPYVIGCNFGPYHSQDYYDHYKKMFTYTMQTSFRDKYSYNLFSENPKICYGSDILFELQYQKSVVTEKYAFFSIINPYKDCESENIKNINSYINLMVELIKCSLDKYEKVICAGFCNEQGDGKIIDIICDTIKDARVVCLKYPEVSMKHMVECISGAAAVFASRYHAMILAMKYNIPVYAFIYSDKMLNVIKDYSGFVPYKNINELENLKACDVINEISQVTYTQNDIRWFKSSCEHFRKLDEILYKC